MAAFETKRNDDVIASINIIPFVDIVLVLLIIFMVTSTAIVKAAIKVELPKAANAGDAVVNTVNLVVTDGLELYIDGDAVTREKAGEILASKVAENPKTQVVISADEKLPYGDVVTIIDFIKGRGVEVFALNIERRSAVK
jgi:biopolymer transport protein ExbD